MDPHNPSIIVSGAQDLRLVPQGGHRWHGYYRSIDGGKTWSSSLVPGFPGDNTPQGLSSPIHGLTFTSDPVMAFDRQGNLYYAGIGTNFDLFVIKYTSEGATFAGGALICTSCADKDWVTVDTSGGQHDGTVYVTYDPFKSFTGVRLVRSVDGGQTFSTPIITTPSGSFSGLTVDASGNVYVSSVRAGSVRNLERPAKIIVAKSTAGGASFNPVVIAASDVSLMPNQLPGNLFRTFTVPQIAAGAGGVFLTWDTFSAGRSDVLVSRSSDAGLTWSAPVRVNDVTVGQHFFPSITVSSGIVSVIWYDSRLSQLPNGTITSLDVFYSSSTDSGASFSTNVRVTSVSFNPNLVERGDFGDTMPFIGDYIQAVSAGTAVHAIWTDNGNACDTMDSSLGCVDQDASTATITL